ncbi:MAG: nickel-dependent hydrogenase large subunit [Oligoflexia bacterium]|nr:nickel-dependent hydrogenase large subunit [Oligoflexia bacterium]
MSKTIIIDPVTRLEGHLKIELTIENNKIQAAKASGTMFRGLEKILVGRDAFDAPIITARICGVCPVSHSYVASVALESSVGVTPPTNARLIRNLILSANFLQSHILHFYHLALLDFMVGPDMPPWRPTLQRDMRFSATENERLFKHYDMALDMRRKTHSMGAIFGGRLPHPSSVIPGGVTAIVTKERIDQYKTLLEEVSGFVVDTYAGDVQLLTETYPEYSKMGAGPGNFISYGAFFDDDPHSKTLFKSGVLLGEGTEEKLDPVHLSESVASSWYTNASGTEVLYPKEGAYSWIKAPRYKGQVMEAGSLARMKVNSGGRTSGGLLSYDLSHPSVLSRHQARVIESIELIKGMRRWLDELDPSAPVYRAFALPQSGTISGIGLLEAPRGALGHWFTVENNKILSYQIITPTCINASPADEKGNAGAMEAALVGSDVGDPQEAIEALRIVHSFDPCLACAVH